MESSYKLAQWIEHQYGAGEDPTEQDVAIWKAARESMRQEAMKAADDQWVKDPRVSASDAIRKIEA